MGLAAGIFDRLAQFLANGFNLFLGRRVAVTYGGEAEEVGRKLGAAGVENEGAAHAEDAAEEARFEDDIVSRRGLTGFAGRRCGHVHRRPVVLGEQEGGEIHLMRELDEALQRGRPGIEGCRPGIDLRDVFETVRQRLKQLFLLAR